MRVTGGVARGRRLKSKRSGVRPTSDLVRAAIFDVLDARGYALSPALDLYAGTGALGIEALSRGGERCDFVERDVESVAIIKENLATTGLADSGLAIRADVRAASERLGSDYALVLADPPYDDSSAVAAIEEIAGSTLLAADAALVLELSSRRDAPEAIGPLARIWTRRYGDTQVSIYRRAEMTGEANEEERR